jgi:hypothetical protein
LSEQQAKAAAEPLDCYAILELMGHVRLAGKITEEQHFGRNLGRIDIPQEDGTFLTQFFSGDSIYRLTPCTEETARIIAKTSNSAPVKPWDLPKLTGPNESFGGPIERGPLMRCDDDEDDDDEIDDPRDDETRGDD